MVTHAKGFSIIELLIVVAIMLIIAAIAIPSLLRARIAANEASAVGSIRVMNDAELTYLSAFPNVGYAKSIPSLGPSASTGCTTLTSANGCLIDWILAQATAVTTPKSGYFFAVGGTLATGYTLGGAPAALGQTGVRAFCSNEDAVLRSIASASLPVKTATSCSEYSAMQ